MSAGQDIQAAAYLYLKALQSAERDHDITTYRALRNSLPACLMPYVLDLAIIQTSILTREQPAPGATS